jgi:hypothetical protein
MAQLHLQFPVLVSILHHTNTMIDQQNYRPPDTPSCGGLQDSRSISQSEQDSNKNPTGQGMNNTQRSDMARSEKQIRADSNSPTDLRPHSSSSARGSNLDPQPSYAEAAAAKALAPKTSSTRFRFLHIFPQTSRSTSDQESTREEIRTLLDERKKYRDRARRFAEDLDNIKAELRTKTNEINSAKTALEAKNHEIESYKNGLMAETRDNKTLKDHAAQLEYERDTAQDKYTHLVRQQQEQSFKALDNGRFIPRDETKVKDDLDALKRSMKTWARDAAIKIAAPWANFNEADLGSLSQALSPIAPSKQGIPEGLSTPKIPGLLLNALLAHDVYEKIFQNPFLCFENGGTAQLTNMYTEILSCKLISLLSP